jgi:hypothetical protein
MATGRIGVTPTLGVRWSKAPASGTTSLSGLDDSSVSLVYSVGYEQVYRNGVLLSRGNDYTATTGTTVTLTEATIAGDLIEIFAQQLVPLTDAISKGQFTAKGALLSATAASTPGVLAVGANDTVLTADSTQSLGLKWASPSAASFVGARAYKVTTAQSISNNTDTAISFNAELFDTNSFHDNSTNNTRMTVPSGKGGKYLLVANLVFAANATGVRNLQFLVNNTTSIGATRIATAGSSENTIVNCSSIIDLVATDYVEVIAFQTSGGSLNINADQAFTTFSITYLGA